jgi:rhamnose transport system substrate-binding protein
MIRKRLVGAALGLALAALVATLFAGPTAGARRKDTIAYLTYVNMAKGSQEAAERLGVRILRRRCGCPPEALVKLYQSMIARHVDAIVSDGYNPTLTATLKKVRRAGILLISSGDDIAGKRDLWVSPSDETEYGHALADGLASQIGEQGEYAILEQRDESPVAGVWAKVVETYVSTAYPNMKLDRVVVGSGAGDPSEVDSVKSFLARHPNLKGLIAVTPTEAYMAAEAITEAGRIGQVFSAGNGGSGLNDPQLIGYVRSGAAELVYGANPNALGYLTVWAAHYLLTGHHFRPGAYDVGGPIGLVYYYAKNQELRLGQPLTVTKDNLPLYAHKF